MVGPPAVQGAVRRPKSDHRGEHAEVEGLLEPGPGHAPHRRLSEAPSLLSHARRDLCLQHVLVVPQDRVDVELGRAVAAFAEARR